MFVEIQNTLRRYRGQIIGWGIGLTLYSFLIISNYANLISIDINTFLGNFTEQMMAFFGEGIQTITTPVGYLDFYFFSYMPIIIGIFAVGAGANLITKDKEPNLVISSDLRKTAIFWGRVIGFGISLIAILGFVWLSWLVPFERSGLNLTSLVILRPFLTLLSQLLFFGMFSFMLSLVLPSGRLASLISGGLLVANYLIVGLANIYGNLQKVVIYTPFHFYQGGKAIAGINGEGLILVLEGVLIFVLFAWYRYLTSDLRASSAKDWKFQKLFSNKIKFPVISNNSAILQFITQRLIFGIFVIGFIIFSSFLGLDMAQGSSLQESVAQSIPKSINYIVNIAQGDFGKTSVGSVSLLPVPVIEVVPGVLVRSFGLLAVSISVAAIAGVMLGFWIAGRRSGWSLVAIMGSIIGVSIPSFFAALLLQFGIVKLTQATGKIWLPVGGFGWNKHLILPALVLAARPFAQITRITFITVKEILSEDYIRTAFGKGLRSSRVMLVHIIRNAAIPILTTIGLSLRFALSSLPVVEYFFGWPGLGFSLLKSISIQDDHLTIALVLSMGILIILLNLLLDLLYLLINPRLRDLGSVISRAEKKGLVRWGLDLLARLNNWFSEEQWKEWFKKPEPPEPSPFLELVKGDQNDFIHKDNSNRDKKRSNSWLHGTLGNPALMIGGILILMLIVVVLFSVQLSPHSPFTQVGLTIIDGEFSMPPFDPGGNHLWGTDVLGRDMLSLILMGTQQTLTLALSVVAVRLIVGFLLGALSGWTTGSWVDRFLLGAAEIISAFPALLLVMILILAIGIRQGMLPFVIGLSFVGWSEIMQYVRSRVMEIRPKLFIESAAAAGASSTRIVLKHVLPNLVPGLISILSLEMGSVLMLLGELGFVGIFIGGGAFAQLAIGGAPYHYSDVPEWGALLSNIRTYARSYPWTAIYPAGAFFIAIAGFNLFGEGIRRLIEKVGVAATRIFVNKYSIAVISVLAVGFLWLEGTTGAIAVFREQAKTFNGSKAMESITILADPEWQGRALGTTGLDQAADYIAQQFRELDLQPAGESMTYFQTKPRSFQELNGAPDFSIESTPYQPVYHQDYVEYVNNYQNLGFAEGPVRFIAMGDLMAVGRWSQTFPALDDLDFSGEIVMVFSEWEAYLLNTTPKAGVLIITDDPQLMAQNTTLGTKSPYINLFGTTRVVHLDVPYMRISENVANHLLSQTGYQVPQLRNKSEELGQDEFFELVTDEKISMEINGSIRDKVEVRHVIGHLPGVKGHVLDQLDNQLIVVLAKYDNHPLIPGEPLAVGANDNASGVAVMLEAVRNMQASGYQPNKTFLFIAYSGEGLEGGEWVTPDISKFLQAKVGFSSTFNVEAIVNVHGLGAGEGDGLLLSTGGSMRLARLFESAARRTNVPMTRMEDQMDLSVVFDEGNYTGGGDEAPYVGLSWDGWEVSAGTSFDTSESIEEDHLQKAGEVLSLALMVLGRETQY